MLKSPFSVSILLYSYKYLQSVIIQLKGRCLGQHVILVLIAADRAQVV